MSLTQARFSFGFEPARARLAASIGWLVLLALTAHFWLGLAGVGGTMVLATRSLRLQLRSSRRQVVTLRAETLKQVWALPGVVCIEYAEAQRLWLFADELEAPVWAALRQFLKLSLPRQALGLSMSR